MGYYIGINTGDLEDTVEDYIIKNSLDGDPDDLWSQNGWGFFEELSTITYDNEALFSDLELEGITTIVPSTNPNFRGRNLVKEIVTWSKKYAQGRNKKYIRMDTVGENIGLITHYKKCGFDFIGLSKLQHTSELPLHCQNATVSLFQLPLQNI